MFWDQKRRQQALLTRITLDHEGCHDCKEERVECKACHLHLHGYMMKMVAYQLVVRKEQMLGEEYADDFVRARTGNAVEDKDEKTREQCRVLLKTLFVKLDSLSHFHFAPKPIIKELSVQKEVAALAMEEVAPQVHPFASRIL